MGWVINIEYKSGIGKEAVLDSLLEQEIFELKYKVKPIQIYNNLY
jgi:hypothetical protein